MTAATMPAPTNMSTKHISHALWDIETRFSDRDHLGLTDVPYIKDMDKQNIKMPEWAKMRNNPERIGNRGGFWSEEVDWHSDGDFAKQIKTDPEKAKTLRKIFAYAQASVPDIFKPGASAEDFAAVAKAVSKQDSLHTENDLVKTFASLWADEKSKASEPEAGEDRSLAIMTHNMWIYRHLWNDVRALKETLDTIDPTFLERQYLPVADRVQIDRIREAANKPFESIIKQR